jgi:hypothetical protein
MTKPADGNMVLGALLRSFSLFSAQRKHRELAASIISTAAGKSLAQSETANNDTVLVSLSPCGKVVSIGAATWRT